MNTKATLLISLTLCCFQVYGQDVSGWNYTLKWQANPSIGVNIPLTKLLSGRITDNLIDYADNTAYVQLITASYFFNKHWGLDFNYQGSFSDKASAKNKRFTNKIQNEYQDRYFVTSSSDISYFATPFGNFSRGLLGVIYRIENKRLLLYPKLSMGITSFSVATGEALLKEKNSNTVLRIAYSPDRISYDRFTIASSLTAGYKMTNRIFLNVEVLPSYYRTDFSFTKSITDQNSGERSTEKIEYQKDIFTLSLGAGVIFALYSK